MLPLLVAAGIASVTIAYDGYGDEGQIERVAAFDVAGIESPIPAVACPRHDSRFCGGVTTSEAMLADALDTLGYEVLARCFLGWENNEGAVGAMTLNVASGAITVEHDRRVTALEHDQRVL